MSGIAVDVDVEEVPNVQLASCVGQDDVSGSRLDAAVVQEVGIRASPQGHAMSPHPVLAE